MSCSERPQPDARFGARGVRARSGARTTRGTDFPDDVRPDGLGLAGTYLLYTISAVISIFLVKKFIDETKGKELEEMEG